MSAFFVPAGTVTTLTGVAGTSAPASNLLNDSPSRVWRTTLNTGTLTATLTGAIDTIALWATNLTASDSVRVRVSSSGDGSSPKADMTVPGDRHVLVVLPVAVEGPYVRIDITRANGNIEATRLMIAKRIECDGINVLAERSYDDPSPATRGVNWATFDRYPVVKSWKFTVEDIDEDEFYTSWDGFLETTGGVRSFVFVPHYPHKYATKAASWGRMLSSAKVTNPTSVDFRIDMSVGSLI